MSAGVARARHRGRRRPPAEARRAMSGRLRVTQVRSKIGPSSEHRGTLRALGLGRIGTTRCTRTRRAAGHAHQVAYLVRVEEADG